MNTQIFSLKSILATTLFSAALALSSCAAPAPTAAPTPAAPPANMTLATTTSTNDTGLLAAILPDFERQYNVKVKVIAVGTGQALKLGEDGNADVVLVHARAQEDDFVAKGFGINRRDVMVNDFIIVGPTADPAKAKGETLAAPALRKIAEAKANFASRGDNSGTNTKEKDLWKISAVTPISSTTGWYYAVGQGMGETLTFANEKAAYTLTDRGTWLAQKARLSNLGIIVGGERVEQNTDPALQNPYGVIPVNPAKHPNIKANLAEQFAVWITSSATKQKIALFGVQEFGQALFRPL